MVMMESARTDPTMDGPPASAHAELEGKYMTFKLAEEEYGLGILRVREIIRLLPITRVPSTPESVRGVINLRGRVIPVVDLRIRFGMERVEASDQTVIIVVQWTVGGRDRTAGLLVDEVLEVLTVTGEDIEPPPDLGTGVSLSEFVLGIGKSGQRVIFLLDIDQILSTDDGVPS